MVFEQTTPIVNVLLFLQEGLQLLDSRLLLPQPGTNLQNFFAVLPR